MPNLAVVACLGSVAWDCACEELYDTKPHPAWQPRLGADPPLTVDVDERGIALFSMSHTLVAALSTASAERASASRFANPRQRGLGDSPRDLAAAV